ncbi:Disks large-like protein 5 [Sciurus carolinensis]|uniref:Disks large-like protein 5 n=1 Tax=Sciurus carolinensis TaxID=30640 RepID=A0AA41NCU3_SCICA|nr:Disks large-like protein 5 [Sciurus carolinensis]
MEALQQIKDTMTMDAGRANKEVEILRKQCKALCQELKEALQEVYVAKYHLDWAFQEWDKIVAEQHSIQTLCNNLRRDWDRAVSELPEALRSLDDSWKQKIDVSRELKELKEQMESQLEKEARFQQLMAHTPHDLAIDMDSMEWETEVVKFEREMEDIDLKALGFDMAEVEKDSGISLESGVYDVAVVPGSPAAKEGSLAVGDRIVAINGIALDDKSLNKCESLLHSCQDSLTLSLLKVFPQSASWNGQNIFRNINDSDKMLSLQTHGLEVQAPHKCSSMQHHSPMQMELFSVGLEDRKESGPWGGSTSLLHKLFPGGPFPVFPETCPSASECSLSSFHSYASGECGIWTGGHAEQVALLSFETEVGPCGVEAPLDKVNGECANSGGTWPKAMLSSMAGPEKLSVYKKPKQRKSIFDPNTFKHPQTSPKIDYSRALGLLTPPALQEDGGL